MVAGQGKSVESKARINIWQDTQDQFASYAAGKG